MSQFVSSQPEKTEVTWEEKEMEERRASSRCFQGKNVRRVPFQRSIDHEYLKWSQMVHRVRDCFADEKDMKGWFSLATIWAAKFDCPTRNSEEFLCRCAKEGCEGVDHISRSKLSPKLLTRRDGTEFLSPFEQESNEVGELCCTD
jgi:hypothetical protein